MTLDRPKLEIPAKIGETNSAEAGSGETHNRESERGDTGGRETLRPVYIQIDPEQLVVLKYIIESYDFLGIIRTLNREKGEIVILAVEDTVDELMRVLVSVQPEIGFAIVPPPESVCEDWLLAETYPSLRRQ